MNTCAHTLRKFILRFLHNTIVTKVCRGSSCISRRCSCAFSMQQDRRLFRSRDEPGPTWLGRSGTVVGQGRPHTVALIYACSIQAYRCAGMSEDSRESLLELYQWRDWLETGFRFLQDCEAANSDWQEELADNEKVQFHQRPDKSMCSAKS